MFGPVIQKEVKAGDDFTHEATISPLDPCTNYSIEIYSVTASELESTRVQMYAATNETGKLMAPLTSPYCKCILAEKVFYSVAQIRSYLEKRT